MWGECLLAGNEPDKHLHAELNSQSLEFCIVFGVSAEIHSGLKKCLFAAVHTDISRVCIASACWCPFLFVYFEEKKSASYFTEMLSLTNTYGVTQFCEYLSPPNA